MEVSNVYTRNLQAYNINRKIFKENQGRPEEDRKKSPCRIVINKGGTRSTKTYSIIQLIISICLKRKGMSIEIIAKERASHEDKALKDFKEIMNNEGLWNQKNFHGTKLRYTLNGNVIKFIGMDRAIKKRGQGRDIAFLNEANTLSMEDWKQIAIRTTEQIFIDYNPSEYTWIDSDVIERRVGEYAMIHSTYKDNPFLPYEQRKEIEDLIDAGDQYYIDVYVHGKSGTFKGKIYSNTNTIPVSEFLSMHAEDEFYGLDWGYEHPMAMVHLKYFQERYYVRQIFYESHRQVEDHLLPFMEENNISMLSPIYCDHAYPAYIQMLVDAGYNALKANKAVKAGISFMQQNNHKIFVTSDSEDLLWERHKYKWKQNSDGKIMEGEPVKIDDDIVDSERYAIYTHSLTYGEGVL
jgi:phage terminase large subunit